MKPPLVSFMLRVRDEEKTLAHSLESLQQLSIPHEVVVMLNNCTDGSEEIARRWAEKNPHVSVHEYNVHLSRAGIETLCTDTNSIHSIVQYCNASLSKCRAKWVFKWDADFVMTPRLAEYLRPENLGSKKQRVHLPVINSTNKNWEHYLSNDLQRYTKYLFWEVPVYTNSSEVITLPEDLCVLHNSELADLKPYWLEPAWFDVEDSPEANVVRSRIAKVIEVGGQPPVGLARASNPGCNEYFLSIKDRLPEGVYAHY
jgi:glycosyltransferase involved in cell wall biosynthesis